MHWKNIWSAKVNNMQVYDTPFLFCLPYAGGSARSLSSITFRLKKHMEVKALELPGRGDRYQEPLCRDLNGIVEDLHDTICKTLNGTNRPVFFWGHSMGATLALLLAERMCRNKTCNFAGLIVSAMTGPLEDRGEKIHLLPEKELLHFFTKLIPDTKIKVDERMRDMFMERMQMVLRADLEALENFDAGDWRSFIVNAPIYVFRGKQDEIMPRQEQFASWRHHTTGSVHQYTLDGGHFFILDNAVRFSEALSSIVNAEVAHEKQYI